MSQHPPAAALGCEANHSKACRLLAAHVRRRCCCRSSRQHRSCHRPVQQPTTAFRVGNQASYPQICLLADPTHLSAASECRNTTKLLHMHALLLSTCRLANQWCTSARAMAAVQQRRARSRQQQLCYLCCTAALGPAGQHVQPRHRARQQQRRVSVRPVAEVGRNRRQVRVFRRRLLQMYMGPGSGRVADTRPHADQLAEAMCTLDNTQIPQAH